ncbi:hypothetical protein V1264_014045 [Littorina saxatilis]|uniref:Uncharacterized protein n=1 Tax=Littorina saxatilis TaxID=31220 RepID=A0AAN9GII5_9CAEN
MRWLNCMSDKSGKHRLPQLSLYGAGGFHHSRHNWQDIGDHYSNMVILNMQEEQLHRMKAEKIRIALEKIKVAKIRKLFVRAFAKDGSSKSILVDEKMTVGQVCSMLADKHHGRLTHSMAVVEHMPELFMERLLEDHDSLVENMVMWTRDSKNKVLFEHRHEKYDLFLQPEKYLLSGSTTQRELGSVQKERLIQEFFSPAGVSVPEVEGALYLKSDGKKAWKKYFFVLRASGLYYNPRGKVSKAPKDLVCLVQFEFVEVYRGIGWKKKYHAPSDSCFALKHPQIQKKTSKYIRYFCAENDTALDQWIMGIRIAKLGKQILHNFERVHHEISTWDLRQTTPTGDSTATSPTASSCSSSVSRLSQIQDPDYQALNQSSLQDSRLSVPEPSPHHTIVTVHNSNLVRNSVALGSDCYNPNEVVGIDVTPVPQRKGSEGGLEGSHKTPTKRVSFSTTHCIITDSCEQLVSAKHRDSIVSASTDSSEDSNSSGEGRLAMANTLRGKLRPKLPVTTETTRLLTEMNQLSFDGDSPGREGVMMDETSSLSSASSTSSSRHHFSRADRRRSSLTDRRGSDTCASRSASVRTNGCHGGTPLSPIASSRRHSHDTSPGPLSPALRRSGTQQWVDDYHPAGMEAMSPAPDTYAMHGAEDQFLYSGGLSHYQQIPNHNHQPQHQPQYQPQYQPQHQHQQQYPQQQHYEQLPQHPIDMNSELYAAIAAKAALVTSPPPQSPGANHGFVYSPPQQHVPPPPPAEVLPPPAQFQESSSAPPPAVQHKVFAPPTAPKPSGPPPPPPTTAHKQPPPPVLPKSVPAPAAASPPQGVPTRAPSVKPSVATGNKAPPPVQAGSRPTVPPPVPPVQAGTSPPPGVKVGPPTLPKSAPATPMSPVSSQGSLKYSRRSSPASPGVTSSSSAPPTFSKGTAPAGYHVGEGTYEAVSHEARPAHGSPHRVSHIKHPSTGSPMLGMPPNNQGPTPSDSGYIEGDNSSSCSGSPSNPPYLHELSQRTKGPSLGTSPPTPGVPTGDQSSPATATSSSANHRRSASAGSAGIKGGNKPSEGGRKAPPPPPPKRSESTRLSIEAAKRLTNTPPSSPTTQPATTPLTQDPIYENCEGILDINELPPPPPELLAGLPESATKNTTTAAAATAKAPKLPPPPPKRSKDTHLTQSH